MKQLWNHLKTKTKTKELTNVGSFCIYIIKNASILAICENIAVDEAIVETSED